MRRMDCIDCHNRPTHIYPPPARSVNHEMSLGWIDPELPSVKSISIKALEQPYTSKSAALDSIKLEVEEYYRTTYPDVMAKRGAQVQRAIAELQKIYSRSYFPEMRVSWGSLTTTSAICTIRDVSGAMTESMCLKKEG